ncbi:hypothetical protein BO78DRAFT_395343 [Aspergillus sclerotiicarbonarius CBS 121057]|uniref:Uncharacterized protein n=1 Tax=Aspergillus sclerotiicarbonarius (strain CBS 121057 / IBT 28362) TaxID=1448318 RepID=A0A319EPL5_ASPSB|nr:hypothetical protein BO78DRAFT_395343 [Aspergillus sclerotiicarbonarius CBS 121057]
MACILVDFLLLLLLCVYVRYLAGFAADHPGGCNFDFDFGFAFGWMDLSERERLIEQRFGTISCTSNDDLFYDE